MITPLRVKAEMARRQLLAHQLAPYPHPDHDGNVDPRKDPNVHLDVWAFLRWLQLSCNEENQP